MAYWTIDFTSRTGRKIHIDISGKQGNTNEALIPAATPLYIEEEGNSDLFVPVKTQSGYITIVSDNVGLLKSIIPIQGGTHTVQVTDITSQNYVLLWVGYVQPKMLSYKIWQGKIRMQIPIECPLSAMRYQKFASSEKFLTVAQMLYMMTKDFSNVVLQGTFPAVSGASADYIGSSWLAKKFFTSAFKNEELNNLEALEKLCTFFGWTCRCGKDSLVDNYQDISVYFIQNRNTDYVGRRDLYILSQSQLNASTPVGTKMSGWIEQTLPENGTADNKAEIILSEGIKNAKATCQLNDFNFQLNTLDDDFISTQWQQSKTETTTTTGKATYYWNQQDVICGDWRFKGDNIHKGVWTYGSNDQKDWEYYLEVVKTAKTDVQHNVPGASGSMEMDYYEVTSWYEGSLDIEQQVSTEFNSKGVLQINFNQKFDNKGFSFYLKLVNGQDVWHYNPTTQTWDNQGGDVECVPTEGKFSAAIPQNMPGESTSPKGKLQLHIFNIADPTVGGMLASAIYFTKIDFDFQIKTDSIIDSSITSVEHFAESGVDFSETKDFDTVLCVKEDLLQGSNNILIENDSITPCESLVDSPSPYTAPFNPLQRLVDEAAAEGKNIGEMLKINIRNEYASEDISPITVFESTSMNEVYYPVSISKDFRDDVTEMKLLKRKYSEEY